MKKLIVICLSIIFSAAAYPAAGQVRSDFSDWNVPPPIPPATIPKQPGKNNLIILPQTEVPVPGQPVGEPVRLSELGPVITNFLNVDAPSQPEFEGLQQEWAGLPHPQAPAAIDPPKTTPNDQVEEGLTAMPDVVAPGMPSMPSAPAGAGATDKTPVLPILPDLMQPLTTGTISGNPFPFTLWGLPGIPVNVPVQGPVIKPGKPAKSIKKKRHTP
jgi:hypothetical protein